MAKFKVCGLTDLEDYRLCLRFGVDYAGFVFYERSPRFIDPAAAAEIVKAGRGEARKVGVFVNERAATIREIVRLVGLDIVQLHGDETPRYCRSLGLPFWKVVRVKDASSLISIKDYHCDTFLLDTFSPDEYGGTGRRFNPEIAREAIKTGRNIVIAGGLSAGNIGEVLALHPFAVDVSGSLERFPGKKCPFKMKAFFDAIKEIGG